MTDYSPPNTFYSETFGLFENEDMYKFIGKNGAHFKYLTTKLGVDYIWWQKETNIIELWGPHYKLQHAKIIMMLKLDDFMKKKQNSIEETSEVVNKKYIKILQRPIEIG